MSSLFNPPATTQTSPLSLHDALPILNQTASVDAVSTSVAGAARAARPTMPAMSYRPWSHLSSDSSSDRKSTRLNSSHITISYAVFCLKKKNTETEALQRCLHEVLETR